MTQELIDKPKDSEDLLALELERDVAREFIRANKV